MRKIKKKKKINFSFLNNARLKKNNKDVFREAKEGEKGIIHREEEVAWGEEARVTLMITGALVPKNAAQL